MLCVEMYANREYRTFRLKFLRPRRRRAPPSHLEIKLPPLAVRPFLILAERGKGAPRWMAEARAHIGISLHWVFFEEIPKLPPGVSEIFSDPVLEGEELRGYDTMNADIRTHDAMCLIDPEVSRLLNQHNITRISFRELRELQRARC